MEVIWFHYYIDRREVSILSTLSINQIFLFFLSNALELWVIGVVIGRIKLHFFHKLGKCILHMNSKPQILIYIILFQINFQRIDVNEATHSNKLGPISIYKLHFLISSSEKKIRTMYRSRFGNFTQTWSSSSVSPLFFDWF